MTRLITAGMLMLCAVGQALAQPIFTAPPLFSDPGLQQCLEDTAIAEGWTLTEEVTYLRCPRANIQETAGIGGLPNLTALDLSDNALWSLAELIVHTGLTELKLSNNAGLELADIIPLLANNTGLTHLGLGGIAIDDFYQLPLYDPQTASDYDLVELDISRTGIPDFNRLTNFPNLRRLDLSGNRIDQLDPWILEALLSLEALDLGDNALNKIQGLNLHTGLTELNLSNNAGIGLTEINPILANNTGLTHLGLGRVAIDDLFSLALNNPQTSTDYDLIELDISHTGVSNLDRLPMFPNLRRLNLGGNQLEQIAPWLLEPLTQLAAIDLGDNALIDISGLDFHTGLTELNLSENAGIERDAITPLLANNPGLTHLGLAGIAIDDFNSLPLYDPIAGSDYALVELDISRTGVSNLDRLPMFPGLRRLGLAGNRINHIDPWLLEPLEQLNAIDLSDNRLSDVTGLDFHTTLVEFNVSNNPGMTVASVFPVLASNTRLTHLGLAGIEFDNLFLLPLYNPNTGRDYDLLELDISSTGVTNLDYLAAFTGLHRLDLGNNGIASIAPWLLEPLDQLVALDLANNVLREITGLEFHTTLRELNLSNNAGLDINLINPVLDNNRGLTHIGLGGIAIDDFNQLLLYNPQTGRDYDLVELDISNTGITSLDRLAAFPGLRRLDLSGNRIDSISPSILPSLDGLTALDLSDNSLNQVPGLDLHTGLNELSLSYNTGIDINTIIPVLANNTRLTHLGLGGIAIADFNLLPLFNPRTGRDYDLVELDIGNTGISNFDRLTAFPGLRRLDLGGNRITTIAPWILPALTDLRALDLGNNLLSDLSGLDTHTDLQALNLSDNFGIPVSAIFPILANNTGLTRLGLGGIAIADLYMLPLYNPQTNREYDLVELDISNTGVTNLDRLTEFPGLRRLDVSDNQLSDIAPATLQTLTGLTALDLSNNALTQVAGLDFHTGLVELNLSNNAGIDIEAITPLLFNNTRLTHLGIGGITIPNATPLPLFDPMTGLDYDMIELDVSNTGITNLDQLMSFPNLRRLNLSGNQLVAIDPLILQSLTRLTALDLGNNALTEVFGLEFHTGLTELNLSNNAGIDINNVIPILANNTRLTHLGLGGIAITNLLQLPLYDPQTGREYNLVELDLGNTGIGNLDSLSAFTNLRVLNLAGNQLTDLGNPPFLAPLVWLTTLDLSGNDLTSIISLDQFAYLTELDLFGNERLQCSDLDLLEFVYGSGNVTRPASCLILNPPTVLILEPAPMAELVANRPVTFRGDAWDPEDGILNSMLEWRSDLDGLLGTGAEISHTLSMGNHAITASVTDSHGNTSSASVTVQAVAGPDGDINADGVVNTADVLLGTRALMGQIMLSSEQMIHADVAPLLNGAPVPDGQFTSGDLMVIQRKVLGVIDF